MAKTQSGVAYYFHAQGRPVKVSSYYEEKMQEEEIIRCSLSCIRKRPGSMSRPAWCDFLFDTILIHLFGVEKARALLGGFSAYTPTSASYYKKMGRYHQDPKEGDQIFFRNSKRIYHTGYVYKVTSKVYT